MSSIRVKPVANAAATDMKRRGANVGERLFIVACLLAVALPLLLLALLLGDLLLDAAGRMSWDFITGYPSRRAARAGILPALVGSLLLISLTALLALPVGVGAAIYLEEYGKRSKIAGLIEV